MAKYLLLFVILFCFSNSLAQNYVNNKDFESASVFGLMVKFTQFDGDFTPVLNSRTGWTIDKKFSAGFDLNLMLPNISKEDIYSFPVTPLGIFAGLYVEPIFWADKMIHMTIPVSGGWGTLIYLQDWSSKTQSNSTDDLVDGTFFRYLEPGIQAEINLYRKIRINAGISYRLTSNLNLEGTPEDAFNAINIGVGAKFGLY
jgi:hypothetical protein